MSLMLEDDPVAAERIAEALEAVHVERRAITTATIEAALAMAAAMPGTGPLALRGDGWAPGVLGLVANRLVESLGRPVAVAAPVDDELRGSVRAPRDFHVALALEACAPLLLKRGGHPAAGGFSLRTDGWTNFAAAFAALPRPFPPDPGRAAERATALTIDLVLPAMHLGWSFAEEIARLAPFGTGTSAALASPGCSSPMPGVSASNGDHVALRMRRGPEVFDAIAFGTVGPAATGGEWRSTWSDAERDLFRGCLACGFAWPTTPSRRSARSQAAPCRRLRPHAVGEAVEVCRLMNRRQAPLDRLRARVQRLGAPSGLGIDPHPDSLRTSCRAMSRGSNDLLAACRGRG